LSPALLSHTEGDISEAVANLSEGGTHVGANRRSAGDDGNRNERGNQAVFDSRRTRLITPQMLQKPHHRFFSVSVSRRSLGGKCYQDFYNP
jgi:hypothetical protein